MLKKIAWLLSGLIVFVLVDVVVHWHLAIGRQVALAALADAFAGDLRVERAHFGLDGVRDARVEMLDPDGVSVLVVDHVDVTLSPLHAARAALSGGKITIDDVHVGDAVVSLESKKNDLRIARAFAPRKPASASSSSSSVRLAITHVAIDHAWVHGDVGGQTVDADLNAASASLDLSERGVLVDVNAVHIEARALPRDAAPDGWARGELLVAPTMKLFARFDGLVSGIDASAMAALDGDRFEARAAIANASPKRIHALAPEVNLDMSPGAEADVRAAAEGSFTTFGVTAVGDVGDASFTARALYDRGAMRARAVAEHVDAHVFAASIGHTDARADVTGALIDGAVWIIGDVEPRGGRAEVVATATHDVIHARARANISSASTLLAPFGIDAQGSGDVRAAAHFSRNDDRVDAVVLADRIAIRRIGVHTAYFALRGTTRDAVATARIAACGPFDVRVRGGLRNDHVAVDALDIASEGRPIVHGSLAWEGRTAHAKLDARSVDLDQVRRTLGLDASFSGHASALVDVRVAGDRLEGRAVLDVAKLDAGAIHDLDAHVDISALGGTWSVVSRAQLGDVGWASVEAMDVVPRGGPFDVESWREARGSVHVDAGGRVDHFVNGVHGDARVALVASRRASEPPDVSITASLRRLVARSIDGLDVEARAHLDSHGRMTLHTDASRAKAHVVADASTSIDWADAIRGRLPSARTLETLPFTLDASVPTHDTSSLCQAFDAHCRGTLDVVLHADGTISDPHAHATFTLGGFRSDASPFGSPVDGTIDATFDRHRGKANVNLHATADSSQAIDGDLALDATRDWFATASLRAHDMPVRAPPAFSDTVASAHLNGTLKLENYHRDARAHVDVTATRIEIEGASSEHGKIAADFDGHTLSLAATMDTPGSLDIRAKTTASWGSALAPSLEHASVVTAQLRAKSFRACTLAPLVPPDIGRIDGRIDADADIELALASSKLTMHGFVSVNDGTFDSTSIGALHDIRGRIAMQRDGALVLDGAQARGTSGLVRIAGRANAPNGTIQDVHVTADVAARDPFPVVVSGDRLGTAWGHVELDARPHDGTLDVAVRVPTLHVVIPDTGYRDLEPLDTPRAITVGVRNRAGVLVPVAVASTKRKTGGAPWTVSVDLGRDVRVERGDMLSAFVTGRPKIQIGEETRITGQVFITRGTLDIEGKRFQIEHGEATFTGDASNPTLIVSATWDAPDGSRVFADYTGPVQNGKLSLRSEPAHTRDEIISLLVFGSASGPTPSSGGSTADAATTQAIGTGASLATQPLNKAISQLTHLDLKTRVDTGSASGARSEVELQVARAISVQVAYVLGLPPPGTDPDRTWLTLMLHLTARWSLDFTMGDHGSSIVDMLWHYRY